MNDENFLFPIYHPHTSGKYGWCLTLLRHFRCLSCSIENEYNVYIVDDFIHSYKSDRILSFLKSSNSYTIYTHKYRSPYFINTPPAFINIPALSVNIDDKVVFITYGIGSYEYSFSLTGEKMTIFLRNIENCYTKFHELNRIEM
jgi:hypothetical protein